MQILDETTLRQHVPAHSPRLDKRLLTALDQHCYNYLDHSSHALISQPEHPEQPFQIIHKQQWYSPNPRQLQLPSLTSQTGPVSLFFWIPAVDHGLRINGWQQPSQRCIDIAQVYLHCGRAAMRADWWQTDDVDVSMLCDQQWIEQARYGFIASQDENGLSQLSPRGEVAGGFRLQGQELWWPERPGNRVAVSMRNALKQPKITLALLHPGQAQLRWWQGSVRLTAGDEWQSFAVDGKTPTLGWRLAVKRQGKTDCQHLPDLLKLAANAHHPKLTPFAKALSEHMSGQGIMGKITHGVVKHVVEKDKRQLY